MDDDGVGRKVEIVMYEGIMMKCRRMMKCGVHVGSETTGDLIWDEMK